VAFLIPENIASRSDVPGPIQAVARCLRDELGDEVTVWLDQDDGEPYLTVLDPEAGVVLLSVPSVTPKQLRGGILRQGRVRLARPDGVLDRARSLGRLFEAEERLGGSVPAAAALALPSISRASLDRVDVDGLPVFVEEDFVEGALSGALHRVLGRNGSVPLDEAREQVVRGIVRPHTIIAGALADEEEDGQLVFRPPVEDEDDVIRVLDREQERLAHHLGEGYRAIRGVAGSGKTLVLVFRAKWYAEHFPNHRVLLTCFNVPLQRALVHELKELGSVKVQTIDSLAFEVCQRHRQARRCETPDDWTQQRERAAKLLAKEGGAYDVVLVDEGQDLDVPGLELAFAALKKRRDDFVIALDGAQNVFRKRARWNPPGQTARGRTTILRRNYRNTREILGFATRFLQVSAGELTDEVLDDPTVIVPPEATSRTGPQPKLLLCRDATEEASRILDLVRQRHAEGVAWGQMAVLYGSAKPWQQKLYFEAQARGIPYFWVSMNNKSKRNVIEAGDVVRVATFQGLKGLEFSRVFLCGVNDIYDPGGTDHETVRKIVYVAMTRAMDEVIVTVSGQGTIGTELQNALG
jgi:hypothetical protein